MSKHRPVSRTRWQASQKRTLQQWRKTNLHKQHHNGEKQLPLLQRYAEHYPHNAAILEIGCGPLCISRSLPQNNIVYLDSLIDDFRRMFPGQLPEDGEFLSSPAERIDKATDSYDLIICLNMIPYCMNPELVLHEMKRLLKPGGKLILEIAIHSSLEARLHYWAELVLPFLCHNTSPYFYALTGMRRTLARHFAIEQQSPENTEPSWLPFCKRQQHIFVCTRLTHNTSKADPHIT